MAPSRHELTIAFKREDLPLHATLAEMLDEHFCHRTDRRGCGFVQATRWLAALVNRQCTGVAAIAAMFEQTAGGSYTLPRTAYRADAHAALAAPVAPRMEVLASMHDIAQQLEHAESRLLLKWMRSLIAPSSERSVCAAMPCKPLVGSCPQAEEFFLEIAHGRVRRGGMVNIVADVDGCPVLVEKVKLGDSHSAISLAPLVFNGVRVPAGALWAVGYGVGLQSMWPNSSHGQYVPLSAINCLHLLRLSTLAVEPQDRRRAFSVMVDAQAAAGLFSPHTTTLDDLRNATAAELASIN